jgi:hypothetical protein
LRRWNKSERERERKGDKVERGKVKKRKREEKSTGEEGEVWC